MGADAQHVDREGCPTAAELAEFLAGRGGEATNVRLEAHLAACSDCLAAAERLEDQSDLVVQSLTAWPATRDDEQEFRRLQGELLTQGTSALEPDPTPPNEQAEAVPPKRLGGYELLDEIGRGASGIVYRARHLRLDRIVAVKALAGGRSALGESPEDFLREMKAVGQFDHPHIVRATDAGDDQGWQYLVMEYAAGLDMSEVVRRAGRLAIGEACEAARQAALGLQHAHEHGVVHRDVKPSNLLLTAEGQIKLLDLGLVRGGRGHRSTGDGGADNVPRGTADYMAPEQWTDYSRVDARADLYSLGCTLVKLATGTAPFHPLPDGYASKMDAHRRAAIPRVTASRPEAPADLDRIVGRLLGKRPEDRYASAAALIEDLTPLSRDGDLVSLAERVGLQRPVKTARTAGSRSVVLGRTKPLVSRRAALASVAAAAALGVAYGRPWGRTAPKVESGAWRALAPVGAGLTPPRDEATWSYDRGARSLELESHPYALIILGRPVTGQFSLRATVEPRGSEARAGLFFRFREHVEQGALVRDFHVMELTAASADGAGDWLRWAHVTSAAPDATAADVKVWASTALPRGSGERPRHLSVTLGVAGFPEVRVDDRLIPESAWTMTTAGRQKSQIAHSRLRSDYVGELGLVASGGAAAFWRPELMYHEAT